MKKMSHSFKLKQQMGMTKLSRYFFFHSNKNAANSTGIPIFLKILIQIEQRTHIELHYASHIFVTNKTAL